MSIQLIRESIDVERLAGEGAVQALVEGSIVLPGSVRDAEPLYVDARMELGSVEVQADRVAADGQVFFTLLYLAGEERDMRCLETSLSFSHILEVPGAAPKMALQMEGAVEHAEAAMEGGRAVFKAVVNLTALAYARESVSCVSGIENVDGLQTLETQPQSLVTLGSGDTRVALEERFELPFGLESTEVLFGTAQAMVERAIPLEDRVELAGQVYLDVYHKSAMFDRPIAKTRHALPFALVVEVRGTTPSSPVRGDAQVRNLQLFLQDEEEEHTLLASLEVCATASAQAREEITALQDAYVAGEAVLSLESANIAMCQAMREEGGVDSIKSVLSLGPGDPPIGVVLAAFVRPAMWEVNRDSRTHAEGVLEVTVLYSPSGGGSPVALVEEVPFRASYDFALPQESWAQLTAQDAEAIQITSERLELKCNLLLRARAYESAAFDVAVDAQVEPEIQQTPGGITLYFVQPGDTLWSVAKRFRITQDALTQFNPDLKELTGTERILLYQRRTNV